MRYKDVCKRDMKQTNIDVDTWEESAWDRDEWRTTVKKGVREGERKRRVQLEDKRRRRKEAVNNIVLPTAYVCRDCNLDCKSRIGLTSHRRRHQRHGLS